MVLQKVKRVVAIEGLIVLGLSLAVYLSLFLLRSVPVALPKYRLEFASGEAVVITVTPEFSNDSDYRKLLEEAYDPSPKLVEKRVKEFVRAANIRSPVKSTVRINSLQVFLSRRFSAFLAVPFVLKLAGLYLVLLVIRFVVWAVMTLRGGSSRG
jgi:hypothetical protein